MENIKNLKTRYDKEDDVLMVFLGKGKVDDTQQTGDVIVHLSEKGEALLLEILNASKFLKETSKAFPPEVRQQVLSG